MTAVEPCIPLATVIAACAGMFALCCWVVARWDAAERAAAERRVDQDADDLTRLCTVAGVLRPARYTTAELDMLREVPLNQWQTVLDAHRLMGAVHTDGDILALLDGAAS